MRFSVKEIEAPRPSHHSRTRMAWQVVGPELNGEPWIYGTWSFQKEAEIIADRLEKAYAAGVAAERRRVQAENYRFDGRI